MQFYRSKNFMKSLRKAVWWASSSTREKSYEMLGINLGERTRELQNTDHGETRLKNCVKYKLDESYRLVIRVNSEMTPLFFGNHDETDKLYQNVGNSFFTMKT